MTRQQEIETWAKMLERMGFSAETAENAITNMLLVLHVRTQGMLDADCPVRYSDAAQAAYNAFVQVWETTQQKDLNVLLTQLQAQGYTVSDYRNRSDRRFDFGICDNASRTAMIPRDCDTVAAIQDVLMKWGEG